MERPAHTGLGHLALHARRLDAMTRFYVDLLGFRIVWQPDPDNVYLSSGRDNLALHRAGDGADDRDRPRDTTLDHLGVLVDRAEDVDRWAAFLEAHGVALAAAPRTHRDGGRSLYVDYPYGNRVKIIHVGGLGWGGGKGWSGGKGRRGGRPSRFSGP
jgi:catechol-2,3-dioxygenase